MKKLTIVIIGAGSTGLSTALSLAQSSEHKIIVLEQNHVGSGQTGQCCGFVRTFYNAPEMITSASYSMKVIKNICKKNKDLEYVKKGLLVIDDLKNGKSVSENVKLLQAQGVKAKYLEQDLIKMGLVKLKRIFPQSFEDFLVHLFSVIPTEFRFFQV